MAEMQTVWSWLPAVYLFLAGLSAGTFLATAVLRFMKPGKFQQTGTIGAWAAVALLAVGLLCLLLETEKPFQALIMFVSFVNFSSWMTIGAWLLLVTFIVWLVYALLVTPRFAGKAEGAVNALAVVGAVLAVCVALYAAVLLGAAPAIALWNTWVLPVLFLVSAVDTGLALFAIILVAGPDKACAAEVMPALEKCVCGMIVLEAIVLAAFVMMAGSGNVVEAASAAAITGGSLSVMFWGGVVVIGLVIPLIPAAMGAFGKKELPAAAPIAGGACALVGGLVLRYVVLAAGATAAMTAPTLIGAMMGVVL